MPNKPNAPLIYTIAIARFPRVPELEKYAEKFFGKIREAATSYPHDEKIQQTTMRAEMGANGLSLKPIEKILWQYLSVDRNSGFILSDDFICFHTSKYHDSKTFLAQFKLGLEVARIELNIPLVKSLGIRYLDLVIPENGKELSKYLESWVLPPASPRHDLQIVEGAYMGKYQTPIGYLNLQAFRNPEQLVPPDLMSPFLTTNRWVPSRPETDHFVVIDTDHFMDADISQKFDTAWIVDKLKELHQIPSMLFHENMGTPMAQEHWSKNK